MTASRKKKQGAKLGYEAGECIKINHNILLRLILESEVKTVATILPRNHHIGLLNFPGIPQPANIPLLHMS